MSCAESKLGQEHRWIQYSDDGIAMKTTILWMGCE